jgi:uncharacterized membrane protein YozB (DUF420 family)
MTTSDLPSINAALNTLAAVLLLGGYIAVKRHRPDIHKRFMIGALIASALFLSTYLVYHYDVGSVPYPHHDWTRVVYFAILIPHVVLAAVMVPFILAAVWFAFRQRFEAHTRITRGLWPVWMFVSVTGVIVYLMLYHN